MYFCLSSLGDFFAEINTSIAQKIENEDDNYVYYYRGCATHNWEYNLIPSVYRNNHIVNEDVYFREMILRSPNDFLNDKTTLEKLVRMQHYKLPTRLLDITSNPLVALYFACGHFKEIKSDGKVYQFKIKKENIKYYDSDEVALIANLAKININKTNFIQNFDNLIHEISEEKPHYLDISSKKNKNKYQKYIMKIFPVKVKLNNNRILRQSGSFLIFGISNLHSKIKTIDFQNSDIIIEKEFIIDKNAKNRIRKSLNLLSINENTLFPELEYQVNNLII